MNNLKFLRYFILSTLSFILLACGGEDNEVEKPIENKDPVVALVFSAQNPPISIPAALSSSQNDHAIAITGFLRQANGITSYASYFNVPDDAEVSNTPIQESVDNRLQSGNNVTVYTWTYNNGNQFVTTAYQLTESGSDYLYEIFFDYGEEDGYIKTLEGKESITEIKNGELSFKGFNESDAELNYEWIESDTGVLVFKIYSFYNTIEITKNPDNSGSLNIYSQGFKNADYTWNASGTSGTYATYDAQGNLVDSGNWGS